MNGCLTQYYRCPDIYSRIALRETPSLRSGYFFFGPGATCYGNLASQTAQIPSDAFHDAKNDAVIENGRAYLTFDPSEVVENLRRERYVEEWRHGFSSALARM
jgi:hypothetical protein